MNLTNNNEHISIIVPLSIVYNDENKYAISVISLSYIMKHLPNKTLYVYETSEELCFNHMKIYKKFEIEYFTNNKSTQDANCVESIHEIIKLVKTKVCYVYDVNLFLPVKSFTFVNMLIENNVFDLIRPYNKYDKGVCISQKEKFNILSDVLSSDKFCISEYDKRDNYGCLLNLSSIICFNKEKYIALNLSDSFFKTDEEDINKFLKFYKKEYNVGFLNYLQIYYFEEVDSQSIMKQLTYFKTQESMVSNHGNTNSSTSSTVHTNRCQESKVQNDDNKTKNDETEVCIKDISSIVEFHEIVTSDTFIDSDDLKEDEIYSENNMTSFLYGSYLERVIPPAVEKRVFQKPNNNKLGVCLIEFRKIEWLRHILNQIANIYGNNDVSLYIVHGKRNERFLKNILKGWSNITFVKYYVDNINRLTYADICSDPTFYMNFNTDFVLKMEWDSFLRKEIPEHFFNYSYVGAPWNGFPNDFDGNIFNRIGNKTVGNGGFSPRNVKRMIYICNKFKKQDNIGEDVHISNCLPQDEVPTAKIAQEFSVEHIYNENPVGLHHVWEIHDIEKITAWFESVL